MLRYRSIEFRKALFEKELHKVTDQTYNEKEPTADRVPFCLRIGKKYRCLERERFI